MKLLYAANKRKGSHLQLNRFLAACKHNVRVAAYKGQNYDCYIDWTLDALCDVFTGEYCPDSIATEIYHDQVRRYAPDLIISDCESITTSIGKDLNIPVWQVSPLLLHYGFSKPNELSFTVKYPSLFNRYDYSDIMRELTKTSDRSFVYSHLCDLGVPIKSGIEWIRPYSSVAAKSELFQHNAVAVSFDYNKPLIHRLKTIEDSILFTEADNEKHPVALKSLSDATEYYGNIRNANMLIMPGCADLLADAFYNEKFVWMLPDFACQEITANILITEYLSLGKAVYDIKKNPIEPMPDIPPIEMNAAIRTLDEEIDKL